ncbi:hypothetical protein L6V77_11780 [Myxococcota bacterium]|nr:hypothetical protein [Myxococcota bacterium]
MQWPRRRLRWRGRRGFPRQRRLGRRCGL